MPPITASSSATSGDSPTIRDLTAYLKRVLDIPGVRDTVNIDHIKSGYYSIRSLNPTGIVPVGPELAWAA